MNERTNQRNHKENPGAATPGFSTSLGSSLFEDTIEPLADEIHNNTSHDST